MNSIKVFVCIAPGGTILPWSVGDGEEWVKGKMCDYEFEQPTGPGRWPEIAVKGYTIRPATLTIEEKDDA